MRDSVMEETIGEIAIKLIDNKLKAKDSHGEGMLCIGPKGSGKTTLMNVFLEKDEMNPKETLSLEYTFGRKGILGQYADKNICNVWELGGAMLPTKELLNVPLTSGGVTFVLIVMDLLQCSTFWKTLREYVGTLNGYPSIPIFIVGGKYDIYKKLDAKQKTQICKMLRAAALLTGAGVFMFSNKEPILIRRAKEILNQLSFDQKESGIVIKSNITDLERPLQIAPGKRDDSWEALGCGRALDWSQLGEWLGEETNGGDENKVKAMPLDPSLESVYREPLIDTMRVKKDHHLQVLVTSHGQSYF